MKYILLALLFTGCMSGTVVAEEKETAEHALWRAVGKRHVGDAYHCEERYAESIAMIESGVSPEIAAQNIPTYCLQD